MFAQAIGVVVTIAALIVLVQVAKEHDYWPRAHCSSASPYGPHDYRCKYFIGQ